MDSRISVKQERTTARRKKGIIGGHGLRGENQQSDLPREHERKY
jgi:hypothetical protein